MEALKSKTVDALNTASFSNIVAANRMVTVHSPTERTFILNEFW